MSRLNTCCPYCGSSNMTADIVVKITGNLDADGNIIAKDIWTPETFTNEVIPSSTEEDIKGFCKDCGKTCNFSWHKGYIVDKNIAKDTKIYLVEYGELLLKEDEDFDAYNIVYDNQYGYYDYEQMYSFDFIKTINKLKEIHKINKKADNYYIIVTEQGTLNDYDDNFDIDDGPEDCDYNMKSVVYYEGKMNGKPIKMKHTIINNALIH